MHPIDLQRVPPFYHDYIRKVEAANTKAAFKIHLEKSMAFLETIPAARWDHRYAEGKWTIKEVVQHMIDAERIFCYRALCFARRDATPLPGFDENSYADASHAAQREPQSLLRELKLVQESSALLFASFTEDDLQAVGIANGKPIYVEAIGFIIVGHTLHHLQIVKERYMNAPDAITF